MNENHQEPVRRRSLRRGDEAPAAPTSTRPRSRRYPRTGKGPVLRWLPGWKLVLGVVLGAIALGVGLFAAAYIMIKVPKPGDFAQAQTTTVYFADGENALGSFSEYDRKSVGLDTLPDHVAHAVVASEDRRFYSNPGIDVKGIARAAWNNVRGKPIQGASTLTQQYVERYYVGDTKDLVGKAKEAILALKIDREQSKEEILENYLNTIYFGRGAYGIETAAEHYFGKSAADLDISEAAMIAGIIPAPSAWDPAVSPERAEERWNRVLDIMVSDEWITQEQRDDQEFPDTIDYKPSNALKGPNGYLVDMVKNEVLGRAKITEDELNTRGLKIVTTIDKDRQDAAVSAVNALPEDRPDNNRVGLASMDPRTGAIVAAYGGSDFLSQPRNAVTQDRAQAGSTFKVWTLIAALKDGYSLYDTFPSYSNMEIDGFDKPVRNYDNFNRGRINLVRATQDSVNTTYALLNTEVGPDKTVAAAEAAGIAKDTPGLAPVAANVLGPASLRPIDQLRAYGTIAAQGVKHEPYIVAEIKDADGNSVYKATKSDERVFDQDVMADATYAMQQVTKYGTAHYVGENLGRPAAGKTGSSNDYRSAWFAGFTPQLVTVVDMYQVGENGEEEELSGFGGINTIAGGTYPTQIWTAYMKAALDGEEVLAFPDPTGKRSTKHPAPKPSTFAPKPTRPVSPKPDKPVPSTTTPSEEPSQSPAPSESPTPSESPSPEPTQQPTEQPTQQPTRKPTQKPTPQPTKPVPSDPGDQPNAGGDKP